MYSWLPFKHSDASGLTRQVLWPGALQWVFHTARSGAIILALSNGPSAATCEVAAVLRLSNSVSAVQVAFLTSFAAFPWVVKPLYGFLSDTVPIFGYRRRSYLIICGLLGAELIFRVLAYKLGINAVQCFCGALGAFLYSQALVMTNLKMV